MVVGNSDVNVDVNVFCSVLLFKNCKKTATPKNLNFRPLSSKFGRKTIESILQTIKGLKKNKKQK